MKVETIPSQPTLTSQAGGLLVAKTLGFVLMSALPLVLVRFLDQSTFGMYKQIFLALATSQSLLSMGFAMSALYFFPRDPANRGSVALNIMLYQGGIGLVAFLLLLVAPGLIAYVVGNQDLVPYAPLLGLAILTQLLAMPMETIAVALQETRLSAWFIGGTQFSRAVLMVGTAFFVTSLRALLIATIVQGLLQFLLLVIYLNRRLPGFYRQFDFALWREQQRYAFPMGLAAIITVLLFDLHSYFVAHYFDAATYAIYAVGCFQLPLVGPLQESVTTVLLPRISVLESEGKKKEAVRLIAGAMRKLAAVYWPLYALLLIVGQDLLVFLYTARFRASWPIFAAYLTLLPLNILILDPVMRCFRELRHFQVVLRAALLAATMVGLWLGILRWGMMGAVAVVVTVFVVENFVMGWRVWRILDIQVSDLRLFGDVAKLALAAALAALGTFFVHGAVAGWRPFLILASCGTLMTLLYISIVWLMGIPYADERARFRSLIPWLRGTSSS